MRRPAPAAAAIACRNSRRLTVVATAPDRRARGRERRGRRHGPSLVDRRRGIDEQRDDVADLLLGQDAMVAEARHVRARGVRVGVVDLAPCVLARLVAESAQFSEAIERRPDRSVRQLLRRQLMTGRAVGAGGILRVIGKLESLAALRDLLAILPVADELAVGRITDCLLYTSDA